MNSFDDFLKFQLEWSDRFKQRFRTSHDGDRQNATAGALHAPTDLRA